MKSSSAPSFMSPLILVLIVMTLPVVGLTLLGTTLPLLSNIKISMLILIVLGMTVCALGGIGRVAAANQWWHPLSIAGYLLGILILILGVSVLIGWDLPVLQNARQVFLLTAGLIGAKILLSGAHVYWLRVRKHRTH